MVPLTSILGPPLADTSGKSNSTEASCYQYEAVRRVPFSKRGCHDGYAVCIFYNLDAVLPKKILLRVLQYHNARCQTLNEWCIL